MPNKFMKLLRCFPCAISFFLGFWVFSLAFVYFFHYDLAVGNLGDAYAVAEIVSALANAVLFGTYLSMATYRSILFKNPSKGHSGVAAVWAFLSALVAGCPACAPTLASALGLVGFVSVFPGGGLGLKIFGAILLSYSVVQTYRNLEACKIAR